MKRIKIFVLASLILTMILSTGCNQKGSSNVESNSNSDNKVKNMTTSSQQKVGKYTIADDSVPLKTGKPNEYCFFNLLNEAYNPLRSSAYSNADTVNNIYNIEELRYIKEQNTYYCIFENEFMEHKEYMYIFFNKHLVTIGMVFSSKMLSFNDFKNIEINKSSSDDVAKIDPASSINSFGFKFDGNYADSVLGYDTKGESLIDNQEGSTHNSYHLTKEGYVKVKYKTNNGKLVVTKVTKKENKIIQGINPLDWPK